MKEIEYTKSEQDYQQMFARQLTTVHRFKLNLPENEAIKILTAAYKAQVENRHCCFLEDDNIKSISLTVFDFNQKAKRIYEKLGFEINEVIETPRLKYIMKRYR